MDGYDLFCNIDCFDYTLIMDSKRELVINLHLKKFRPCDILKQLKHIGVNKRFIFRTIKRFKETGTYKISQRHGPLPTVRTKMMVKRVRERIRRNPAQSGRAMAKDLNVSHTSIQNILTQDLKLRAYKKQRVHGLTEKQKKNRVIRSKALLQRHADCEILFSDEKMFLLQDTHNQQNDRVYAVKLAEAPRDKLAVQRFQNVSRVMVWGAVSRNVKLPLLFIEPGVKINTNYYIEHVLKNHLMLHASKLIPDGNYCFQQDSAPSHQSKATQEWCRQNLAHFISSQEWPASSPDLNPLDYFAWGYMLSKIGSTKGHTLESFKQLLIDIWDNIPQEMLRASCAAFKKRLQLVIKGKGERFELNM